MGQKKILWYFHWAKILKAHFHHRWAVGHKASAATEVTYLSTQLLNFMFLEEEKELHVMKLAPRFLQPADV